MQQTTQPTRPTRREKVGVIDVGGGLRSAYSTGVLDYCLDNGIHFDYGLGVSAGAANITSRASAAARCGSTPSTAHAPST